MIFMTPLIANTQFNFHICKTNKDYILLLILVKISAYLRNSKETIE